LQREEVYDYWCLQMRVIFQFQDVTGVVR